MTEVEVIERNRALAYLKTKQFDAALSDTEFPLFPPKPSDKALFRAAEALYYLGRYSECCDVLGVLCAAFPDNAQASEILDRARSRLLERKLGTYDFKKLQSKAMKLRLPHFDAATYICPVEIRQTKLRGRGLFVTKPVKVGDLLLCEKAFSRAHVTQGEEGNDEDGSKITFLLNIETNRGFLGAQADLIRSIVQKLHRNPSIASAFTTWSHGPYEAVTTSVVDGEPIVDTQVRLVV